MAGTAVLVHGAWSNPRDWDRVRGLVEERGMVVDALDLPSCQSSSATLADDAGVLESAVLSARPPVVVAGWSYGCNVISDADLDPASVVGLVYLANLPPAEPSSDGGAEPKPAAAPFDLSVLRFPDDRSCVLDESSWIETHAAAFPAEVTEHLRSHPRRPIALDALLAAPSGNAWRQIPTTILLGRDDVLCPASVQEWAIRTFPEVRIIDGDHFLPLLAPTVVADAIVEAADPSRPHG